MEFAMELELDTMLNVAKKKTITEPTANEPKERPGYPLFARLDDRLGAALDAYLNSVRPRPTKTTVVEMLLEDFLTKEGFLQKGQA